MTREEIIQGLYRGDSKAIKEAIKALEQEPCEDKIIEWKKDFKEYVNSLSIPRDDYKGIMEYIDELPVTPQPKTGYWIEIAQYSDGKHKIECSECKGHIFSRGHANSFVVKNEYKFCPHCGKRMVEPQESEGKE